MPWPPGARPLLAAIQSGSSSARKVSHCRLPSCSQLVYMLQAPLAGAATEMPLPASVFIAPPAVTQLLTSGPALNASSSTTMCGPPPMNATGMSRPIAADGTISVSTSALAFGAVAVHNPAASATVKSPRINPRIKPALTSHWPVTPAEPAILSPPEVVNHIPVVGRSRNGDGGDPLEDRRRRQLLLDTAYPPVVAEAGCAAGDGCGVAPSTRWMSGFICCSCEPQYGQSCTPLDGKLNTPFLPPAAM